MRNVYDRFSIVRWGSFLRVNNLVGLIFGYVVKIKVWMVEYDVVVVVR